MGEIKKMTIWIKVSLNRLKPLKVQLHLATNFKIWIVKGKIYTLPYELQYSCIQNKKEIIPKNVQLCGQKENNKFK